MVSPFDNQRNFIAESAKDFRAPRAEGEHDVARSMWAIRRINLPAGTILPQASRIALHESAAALDEQAGIGLDERAGIGT